MKEKSAKLLRRENRGCTFPNKFWNKTLFSEGGGKKVDCALLGHRVPEGT